jgi:formate dehydrogenase subunit delta
MENQDVIRMANQIAAFYERYPRDEGIKGVAEHITMFWDPRMRRKLSEMISAKVEGFSELALAGAVTTVSN